VNVKFRLAEHVVCRQTNSDLRMLFDRRKGVMYELNESASAIVGLLEQAPATAESLSDALLGEFDAPPTEVRADVSSLLADFLDADLVTQE
jgi:PqqD family protein of HPr-rel-A system